MKPSILIQHLVLKIGGPGLVQLITLTPFSQILAKWLSQMTPKYLIRHVKKTRDIPLKHILDGNLYASEKPLMVLMRKRIPQSVGFSRRKRCLPPERVYNLTYLITAQGVIEDSVNACMSRATFQAA